MKLFEPQLRWPLPPDISNGRTIQVHAGQRWLLQRNIDVAPWGDGNEGTIAG